jgi:hypothetical protein
MLDTLFLSSRWQHTDMYSNCDPSIASHHYFDASWDLAFERDYASSQREHETRQSNGKSRKRAHNSSVSEGNTSHTLAPPIGASPLRRNSHSHSSANSPPAPDPKGAVFSFQLRSGQAGFPHAVVRYQKLAPQQHHPEEAPPLLVVPARTPIGDDSALPSTNDIIPIVSQLGSLDSPSHKRIKITGEFSDSTSECFPSIMLLHLNALVSQFESFGNTKPFSSHSNND